MIGNNWQKNNDEDPDPDKKEYHCSSSHPSNQNSYSRHASTKAMLDVCTGDNRAINADITNGQNSTLSFTCMRKNKEVSRKGNGMGVSGWKSQFCMNGISFCFKVGTLFKNNDVCFVSVILSFSNCTHTHIMLLVIYR